MTLRIGNQEIQLTDDLARALSRFDDATRQKYLRELADAASDADSLAMGQRIIAASGMVGPPKGLPATTEARVADKLKRYLLNPDHPHGRAKAK